MKLHLPRIPSPRRRAHGIEVLHRSSWFRIQRFTGSPNVVVIFDNGFPDLGMSPGDAEELGEALALAGVKMRGRR